MATRKNLAHSAEVRERIQTSQLVNRLTDHVFGKADMSRTQVAAAVALLKKTLPDLQATSISGEDGGPVQIMPVLNVSISKSRS